MSFWNRRLFSSAAIFCGLFACAFAQAVDPTASLEGSVLNKITGAPVRHAHVMYIKVPGPGSLPVSTDTDADGRFAVALEPGSYRLWVERPGFAHQAYGSRTPDGTGTLLTVASGQQMRDVNLRIVPLGAISGRVLDEDGEPLQGAGIQVLRFSFATGKRQLIPVTGVGSNDRGEYRAYGLPAGRYFLMATLRGAPSSLPPEADALLPEMQQSFASVYYPGVLDFTSASQISLPEGGEITDADFHLQKTGAIMVTGRLFSPIQDFTRSRLQVALTHSDRNTGSFLNPITATVDENTGRFEFHGIAPGSYLLVASQLHNGALLSGRLPVEVNAGANPQTVNVTLAPAFDITGSVEIEGGSSAKVPPITVQLAESEGLAFGRHPSAKVAPDGTFRLTGVASGIWDFTLSPLPEDLWIKTATLGDLDVLSGQFNVASATKGPLRIVLAGNGAQISGSVTQDGQPSRAVVVLAPAASELQGFFQMYRSITTQENGSFLLKGVRPGAYKLFAFEDIEAFSWLDPDFLKPVEALGESISVGEGEKATRQLTPISPDLLLPGR
ncbi:MAG TPA: carboxypeptidase-like regulatory domain-containing protein [Candidatus Angelobacter sp.]|nr:carboxypeptidase-like regulatory domain-containing protein [Candidatus Angelobacter sp.]